MKNMTNKDKLLIIAKTYACTKNNRTITCQELRDFLYETPIRFNGDIPKNAVIALTLKRSNSFKRNKVNGKTEYVYID